MPQMAPISWLILFFVFSAAFLMFNVLNYFCLPSNNTNNMNNKTLNMDNNNNNNNKINWKW